jgi:hypothetical protein
LIESQRLTDRDEKDCIGNAVSWMHQSKKKKKKSLKPIKPRPFNVRGHVNSLSFSWKYSQQNPDLGKHGDKHPCFLNKSNSQEEKR